jgi:hypothetical protein
VKLNAYVFLFLLIGTALAIFVPNLPSTVQTLDTGELVRAAFTLQIPHPPGYPLFTFLLAGVISILPIGSVFLRAALLNSLFSIFLCCLAFCLNRRSPLLAVSSVLILVTSRIFWKYSELPDVFILNSLFAALISFIYLDEKMAAYQKYLPFVFFLGLTNHLTLVFLGPLILHAFIINIRNLKTWLFSLIGLILFICTYLSLLIIDSKSLASWGNIQSAPDLVQHFLRTDYGTLQLMAGETTGSFLLIIKRFSLEILSDFFVLFVAGFTAFILRAYRFKTNAKEIIFIISTLLYIFIFFAMSNITPDGFYGEIIDRFYILSLVLLTIWASYQIVRFELEFKRRFLLIVLLLTSCIFNYYRHYESNNLSKNTIVEDYAKNLLNMAPEPEVLKKPIMVLATTDVRYFALEYVQDVFNLRKDIIIVHPRAALMVWYREKLKDLGVSIANEEKIVSKKELSAEDDLVMPNLKKFDILTHLEFKNYDRYKIIFMPLGRFLTEGSGVDFYNGQNRLNFRYKEYDLKSNIADYDIYRELWSDYGATPYIKGINFLRTGSETLAKAELEEALKLVPWNVPALKELCLIEKNPQKEITCRGRLHATEENYYPYLR